MMAKRMTYYVILYNKPYFGENIYIYIFVSFAEKKLLSVKGIEGSPPPKKKHLVYVYYTTHSKNSDKVNSKKKEKLVV